MAWHKLTWSSGWHCDTPGGNCRSQFLPEDPMFSDAKMISELQNEVHDESLVKLTQEVNRLIEEAAQKRNDRNLRIALTSHGLAIIWTHKGSTTSIDSPELTDSEMLEELGL
jgi:hypothetical protein